MELFLIDAIGPFFKDVNKKRINWSKVPFDLLELDGPQRRPQFDAIRADMQIFASRASATGFNAATLDDLSHLADHPWYEPEVRRRLRVLREEFTALFDILQRAGLQVFLTMDVFSATPALDARLKGRESRVNAFLAELIDNFFTDFPSVAGLILRFGESDGVDVKGVFKSRLHLKTPGMVNRMLGELLPVFERHQRRLILRTWTVGAYRIGDFMWHHGTFARALKGIDSPALVLSMKYGESDYFRYLPLNRNFFRTHLPKIIELQTRREYEGCGEYPSFVGWDYERYARELQQAPNMLGISVWCQTGGWTSFRRRTYIDESGVWNELNTYVTLALFKARVSVSTALEWWAAEHCSHAHAHADLLQLCRLSDEVIKELLYTEQFAVQTLFFRRVRIPPLLGVYWSTIFINHSLRKIMRHYVADPEACVRAGYSALAKIRQMQPLARSLGLPEDDIVYMKRTFKILALARQYFFHPYDDSARRRLEREKKRYKKRYPKGTRTRYTVRLDFSRFRLSSRFLRWFLAVTLRQRSRYRLIDYVLTMHLLALIYRLLSRARPGLVPKFARDSAMGIDIVFR